MKVIGLVGGVASGKSLVAKILVELGAGLLDADRTGHAVLAEDPAVQRKLHERWGDAVFAPDGSVDRRAIAKRVFASGGTAEVDRRFLEDLLHHRIRRRLLQMKDQFAAEGRSAVVLDAPVLLEAGWGPMCDILLMVDVPREIRLKRALSRGWTEEEFNRREAAQWPVADKRRESHFTIANDGSEADLRQAVQEFWHAHVEL
ncbi:MAG TPA: dephospho-CoA kinase [Lacipirellulaceae bacterium]|jgi:dephospho-CoA kinase|nr:dephospho-CoA kinase [Lacipirellulaceae bacterium]